MTLPALITVQGIIRDKSGPVAGRISFVRSAVLFPAAAADQNLLIPEEVVVTVDADGVLSQQLYASNDPVASPTGWTWEVRPFFRHWKTAFSIVVPYDAIGGVINLNELAPVPSNGTGALYALANHTHPGGGSVTYGPVTAETAYGASSNSGVADSVSRSDHRHGNPAIVTPADIGASPTSHNHNASYDAIGAATSAVAAHEAASDPHTQYLARSVATTKGDLLAASGSAAVTRLGVGMNGQVLTADSTQTTGLKWAAGGGGGGSTIVTKRGYVTSGDVVPQNSGGAWQLLTGGPTFSIPAAVGDEVRFDWAGMRQGASSLLWDFAVIVSGAAVRYASSGTATPAIEGDPGMYQDTSTFRTTPGLGIAFIVGSGDLSGGNVVIGFAIQSASAAGKLFASTNYPLRWHLTNFGPQT